jgi:hypothetical protein
MHIAHPWNAAPGTAVLCPYIPSIIAGNAISGIQSLQ